MAESWRVLEGHRRAVWAVDWVRAPDGRLLLASGSYDETIRIWDAATWECVQVLAGHEDAVASVRWVEPPGGGLLLASGDDDGVVRIWDAETWDCRATFVAGDVYQGRPPRFPLLRRLARRSPPSRLRRIRSLDWTHDADGRLLLVTSSYDETVRIWDAGSWTCGHILTGDEWYVMAVAAATGRDGRALLASGAYHGAVRIWDAASGECVRVLRTDASVYSVAWTTGPDGRLLLAGGGDRGRVWLWDAETWELRHEFRHERDPALPDHAVVETTSLAWIHPPGLDGGPLLAGTDLFGGRVRVWDAGLGTPRRVVDPFGGGTGRLGDDYVIAVAWAGATGDDGVLRLAVGGGPKITLTVWDVSPENLAGGA